MARDVEQRRHYWKYVTVRALIAFLTCSMHEGTHRAVFEPYAAVVELPSLGVEALRHKRRDRSSHKKSIKRELRPGK